ncbi:hypothetical protein [Vibrio owensii]|uniref:hypothetical protein n=1 Tax=Vibrio owensii TaxID=696485 RepID=UPI0040688AF3
MLKMKLAKLNRTAAIRVSGVVVALGIAFIYYPTDNIEDPAIGDWENSSKEQGPVELSIKHNMIELHGHSYLVDYQSDSSGEYDFIAHSKAHKFAFQVGENEMTITVSKPMFDEESPQVYSLNRKQ